MKRLSNIILGVVLFCASLGMAQAQVYVSNLDEGTVSEYDATTGALLNPNLISGLQKPRGVAWADGYLYVTQEGDDPAAGSVGKYDAATGTPINAALVPNLVWPQSVAVSGSSLYIGSLHGDGTAVVGKYDTSTGAAINANLVQRLQSNPWEAVADNNLFIISGAMGTFGQYDATTGVPINSSLLPYVMGASGLAVSGRNLWFTYGAPKFGGVVRMMSDTVTNPLGPHKPLVDHLDFPHFLALSGDTLFVVSEKTIGQYNAMTGQPIHENFIAFNNRIGGIAAVPVAVSPSASALDIVVVLAKNWDNIVVAILASTIVFVGVCAMWFVSVSRRQQVEAPLAANSVPVSETEHVAEPVPVVPPVPIAGATANQQPPARKWIAVGTAVLVLALVGGYATYQWVQSIYIADISRAKNAARQEMEAEMARAQATQPPTPSPARVLERVTFPAVLVDPQNFKTENNWLACLIARRMAGLAYLAQNPDKTPPQIEVQAQVKAEEHQVHLEIKGFASDPVVIDLKPEFAWDPQGYAPLATKLLGDTKPDLAPQGETLPDELTTLLNLTGPTLAQEDMTLSALLQKHPAWPAVHEQAALLLTALAIRDCAGSYSDIRAILSRATAHLALAQALRGSTPPTWAGEIADVGIRALSGREVDALSRLDALAARTDCPEVAKTWITALRLRAKDDWRAVTPDASSPLLLRIVWFQSLNNNLNAIGAVKRWEKLGTMENVSDWGHACLADFHRQSVETDNEFCQATTALELTELGDVLKLENATPDASMSIGSVLADPLSENLYPGQPAALKIIGPDMLKDFARRHLLMELNMTHVWLDRMLGAPDEAEKFRSATSAGFAGMRRLENLGLFAVNGWDARTMLKELNKTHKTWEPWEVIDAKFPGNPIFANIHPDIDTLRAFYQDGLPFGTAYNLTARDSTLSIGAAFHKKQPEGEMNYDYPVYPYAKDLRLLAPSSYTVFTLDQDRMNSFKNSQPWWDYNLVSIQDAEQAKDRLDEEDYTLLEQKHAALDPAAWFDLGTHLRAEGKDDAAADADRKGFDQAYDQVGMSNAVGPLIDYYFDHDRKEEAEMVAKRAADVYSANGLSLYGLLLEKMGRLDEAEQNLKDLADRYGDKDNLNKLYAAHPDHFQDQAKQLTDKTFPHGMEKVTLSSFSTQPRAGCVFTTNSPLLEQASLQVGDVVVALDGYRVESEDQYIYIVALSKGPMDLIIWRNDRYLEVHASPPDRKFQIDLQTYNPASQ